MYDFPPPIWQNQDWTINGILSVLILGLLLPLTLAHFTKPTAGWMFLWSAMIAFTSFVWTLSVERHGTWQPHLYWRAIPCSLIMIGIGTIVRLWWKTPTKRGPVNLAFVSLPMTLIFANVLLPGVSTPPEHYRRMQCKYNLKQIGLAMHNYSDRYDRFPAANSGEPAASWRVALLPFVDHRELAKRYDFTRAWDSVGNAPLQFEVIQEYDCPSRPTRVDRSGRFLTAFVVPTMAGSLFDGVQGPQLKDITDGAANTILAVESCSMSIVWSEPRDADPEHADISINGPGAIKGQSDSFVSSWHARGAQVALADGSVRFMNTSTSPAILKSLLTKDAGDVVGDW